MYGHTCVHDLQIWHNQSESQDGSKSHSFTFAFYSSPLKFFIVVLICHILLASRIKWRSVHHPSPPLSPSTRHPRFSSNSPPIWPPLWSAFPSSLSPRARTSGCELNPSEPRRFNQPDRRAYLRENTANSLCAKKNKRASRWVLPDTSGEREAADERARQIKPLPCQEVTGRGCNIEPKRAVINDASKVFLGVRLMQQPVIFQRSISLIWGAKMKHSHVLVREISFSGPVNLSLSPVFIW